MSVNLFGLLGSILMNKKTMQNGSKVIIDLSNPLELPLHYIERLNNIKELCESIEFSDEFVQHQNVRGLVRDINEYCLQNKIVGIHYTRAEPESILKKGLLIRNGRDIREIFLNEYGYLFSEDELIYMRKVWHKYYRNQQESVRDGRVFFNFTETALDNRGAEFLLGMYGGEQINMCFEPEEPIGSKLNSIGKAMVVRCSLDPHRIKTFIEHPWGQILMSSFHSLHNHEVHQIDQDGYQFVPVKPEDILEIRVLDQ